MLAEIHGMDVHGEAFRALCERHGTPEIHERFRNIDAG